MSRFADAWTTASRNIDAYFGEAFTFKPIAYVGGKYGPDPARSAVAITAAFDSGAALDKQEGVHGSRVVRDLAADVATMHANIDLATDALPYAPVVKDRLTRQSDGAVFEVSAVLQDDFARITLRVMKVG